MSEESIGYITQSDKTFKPSFVDHHLLPDINFNEHCLINNIYIHKKVISIFVSYPLTPWLRNLNIDFTLNNYLFGSVKRTESGYALNTNIVATA